MRILALLFCLFGKQAAALDAEEIRSLIKQPHSREKLIPELRIYPEAREYEITMLSGKADEPLSVAPRSRAKEHTVGGMFLVSEFIMPGAADPLYMVVEYQLATETFRKWVLLPDGKVVSSTGVPNFDTRCVAWMSDEPFGEPPTRVLSIETHTDQSTSWREVTLQNGKGVWITEGKAVVKN